MMQVDRDGGSVAWNWRVCCLSTVNSVGMWEVGGGEATLQAWQPLVRRNGKRIHGFGRELLRHFVRIVQSQEHPKGGGGGAD